METEKQQVLSEFAGNVFEDLENQKKFLSATNQNLGDASGSARMIFALVVELKKLNKTIKSIDSSLVGIYNQGCYK
jgi:hypothetical protein